MATVICLSNQKGGTGKTNASVAHHQPRLSKAGRFTRYPRKHYAGKYGAENTKLYKKAQELQDKGMLAILTEDQFFDVLENGAEPPAVKIPRDDIVVIPAREPKPPNPYLRDMRLGYLANKRFDTPEGEMKIDLRPLYRVADAMGISDEKTDQKTE